MKLYFHPDEFLVTDIGYKNVPRNEDEVNELCRLAYTLNTLRGLVGCPITILSAYRSNDVNAAVGGSPNSYHLFGRAADITCCKLHELLDLCMKLHDSGIFVEVIYYPERNFIHVAI